MRAPVVGCCAFATEVSMQREANAKTAISKILLGIESRRTKRAIKLLLDSPGVRGARDFVLNDSIPLNARCPADGIEPLSQGCNRRSAKTQVIRLFCRLSAPRCYRNPRPRNLRQ